MSADTHSQGQQLRLNLHVPVIGFVYIYIILIFPVVCVKQRPELCHQLVESDLSPAKLLGAQSLLGVGPGRRVVTAGDAGDFLHIDSDWAFFNGRGASWLELGVEGEQQEEVQWRNPAASVTVISLKGMVD